MCYISFKTKISFKKHMKRGAHLLATGPEDVRVVCEGIIVVFGWEHIIWQNSGNVFVCKGCDKKFKINNSIK